MKKINFTILIVFLLSMNLFGFDKQNQVISGLQNGNYENVKRLLQEWEKESPKDPDLMTGWFNYYLYRKAEEKSFEGYMQNGMYGSYSKTIYDEEDLRTAISEAVTNCIVHGYKGNNGIIYINLSYYDDRTVKISVRDKGCGIEDIKQAMQPLFTTDRSGERGGMGFTVMKSFCDKMRVTSKIGKGTSVFMEKKLR